MQFKKLHILGSIITYKASAGSGKTFTLVYDYIKYLFLAQKSFIYALNQCKSSGDLNNIEPDRSIWQQNVHRRTLAVTFTNKSTAEMKERIIVALSSLSDNPTSSPYLSKLRDELLKGELKIYSPFSEGIIKIVSSLLLSDILQDFSGFRVQTIDGFFQQVVRSFASELDINNKYQVELDTQQIFDMAVDNMLASLDSQDSQDKINLLNWLTEYAKDKVDDSKSWNPRGDIQKLTNLLLSENYVIQAEEFNEVDNDALNAYRDSLKEIVEKFETELQGLCADAKKICENIGYDKFNSRAISSSTFDIKTIIKKKFKFTKTFTDAAGNSDKWCKKDKLSNCNFNDLEALSNKAKDILDLRADTNNEFIEYNTSKIILSNLYIVGILGELSKQVTDICLSNDLMIIASTTKFLQQIKGNSDTPFIYEKIGVKTDHYMIDEFQDTSNMQWENFIPLLKESVSSGNESMLVGDVKQSIYRWRNGDWNILHSGVKEKFSKYVTPKTLDTNYRSCTEVVNFANSLFASLPKSIDDQLPASKTINFNEVYSDSKQELPQSAKDKDKYQGYVKCTCFKKEDASDDLSTKSLDSICEDIGNLKDKKIPFNDMAVLVRTNKEARMVADYLRDKKIPFCSADALLMGDNGAVKFLIATIRYISQPYEPLNRANFFVQYNDIVNNKLQSVADFNLLSKCEDFIKWEQEVFETTNSENSENILNEFQKLKNYPLIRMLQTLDSIFKLRSQNVDNTIFLQAFFDRAQEFANKYGSDVKEFLKYWDDKCTSLSIPMSDDFEGVRILTIHKSKGLEFDIVFVPFCDWDIKISPHNNNYMLFTTGSNDPNDPNDPKDSTDSNVFDKIPLVPINTKNSSSLMKTIFRDQIQYEYESTALDVLNTLYVAVTRAKSQLYLNLCLSDTKESDAELKTISVPKLISDLLKSGKCELLTTHDEENIDESSITTYEFGDLKNITAKPNKQSTQYIDITYPVANIAVVEGRTRFRYSNISEDFADDNTNATHNNYSARKEGILLHAIMSKIVIRDDLEEVLSSYLSSGDIDSADKDRYTAKIKEIFENETVREWFSVKYEVLNEVDIYESSSRSHYRPDRVIIDKETNKALVVDYKFGDITPSLLKKYQNQVQKYVSLLTDLGYETEGKILHTKENPVEIIDIGDF